MRRNVLLISLVACAAATTTHAAATLWTESSRGQVISAAPDRPSRFRTYRLARSEMAARLGRAPRAIHDPRAGVVIELPLPDGRWERFRVAEYPVLSPELMAAYPWIHAYRGTGVDRPHSSMHLVFSPLGLRAMIFAPEGVAFLDPVEGGRDDEVMTFWDHDGSKEGGFECRVEEKLLPTKLPAPPQGASDPDVRVLRLVLIGSGEYTQALGGVQPALVDMVTSIDRLNAIFERDMRTRFEAVGLTAFPDPNTDPYDGGPSIEGNQVVVDSIYGHDAYDLAQVENRLPGSGTGGISAIMAICQDWKAQSLVAAGVATPNDRIIRVMAHELGHTLGARHVTSCPSGFDKLTAVEPGGGTTIMGSRARLCGTTELAPVNLYFNSINIIEVADTLASLPPCGTFEPTGNHPPSADAGPDVTIPRETPFVLVGSGFDPDPFDMLTYVWDQNDVAPSPQDSLAGPIFQFVAPTTSPLRYLPAWGTVLADTLDRWEPLPANDRVLRFRLLVRDNHPGAGAVAWDEKTITVSGEPFAMTFPNGGESIPSGHFSVTWDVGGGVVAPAVDIALSTDGGASWSALATNVPNDGSQDVAHYTTSTLPECRVRVSAVGNIFYDVSHANFTIQGGTTDADAQPLAWALRTEGTNPSSNGAKVGFDLPRDAVIHLGVYAVSGRLVRTLAHGMWPGGRHAAIWDGKDGSGRRMAAGVYWVRIASGGRRLERRIVTTR